ncbi:peptide chain release factor N(5)-glutamine methyltransferase [Pseudoalteromonas piscicida]|uniref:Release factor glutamine methyltransferase n=1 Tax=Pseudoalteromonas piscicida TaxID=43662 RepID=A0AAQ2EQL3_PSEO7|nr:MULTISPECIES: peptide chain release factor N(5)-glutamine methyltransferase [Pseudoalteromonas]KJY92551.1 SAM-dependent methyltransferase [Pseudoalteromonas piscicida]KJY97049.1 SAM-dependent methyltransferase [Pseudoalteromonas piscicida]TMN36312.1 peptide chain release factor N(5)-glutamine methyltransferase [Pseudoalteromonas piscicida]TMN38017.1 peptide chain release factor N(5)-glutamine methyltransferase [Pseudoalteromonas piscicida]TMN47939.1 peptide chain release factor N(5)-glutami
MPTLNIAQAVAWATSELLPHSESAKLDSEVLLLHVIDKNRTYLFTWPEAELSTLEQQRFEESIARRVTGEPVAHITGQREFWSLPLKVNNSTLIPRPDTETLVEHVLTLSMPNDAQVLDLGTGTGAIALALASEYPAWQITAVDASADAVALAKSNQSQLGFKNVSILQSDWFSAVAEQQFDLIVSNPPYIDEADHHLSQGDVRFEPLSALVADDHGYADIFHIIRTAKLHLNSGGYLLLEHGFEQADKIQQFFAEMAYINILTIKDMAGCDRVTLAMLP